MTNRTPITRASRARITLRAIQLFRQMEETGCSHDERRRLHNLLCDELHLPPWQDIEKPGFEMDNPRWKPDLDGQRLYAELARALTLS